MRFVRIVAAILLTFCLGFAPACLALGTYSEGFSAGKIDADSSYTSFQTYFAIGTLGGAALGLAGGLIAVGVAATSEVKPETSHQYDFYSLEYQQGYLNGYAEAGKRSNMVASVLGSVLGFALNQYMVEKEIYYVGNAHSAVIPILALSW